MRFAVLLAGVLGTASAALLARYGLDAGADPVLLAGWRLAIASVLLAPFGLKRSQKRATPDLRLVLPAGLALAAHFATWLASLEYVSIARSTLLVSTSPLWAGALGLCLPRLRPKPIFWAGLLVAGIGTYFVTAYSMSLAPKSGPPWLGDLLATLGAICVVPYLNASKSLQDRIGTTAAIKWIYTAAACFLWIFLIASGKATIPSSPRFWLSVVGMALFAQILGHGLINRALRYFTTPQVASATLLEPVFAGALAWVFFAERLGPLQTVGGVILLAGVALSLQGEPEQGVAELL